MTSSLDSALCGFCEGLRGSEGAVNKVPVNDPITNFGAAPVLPAP
jgi:hypothetical protein